MRNVFISSGGIKLKDTTRVMLRNKEMTESIYLLTFMHSNLCKWLMNKTASHAFVYFFPQLTKLHQLKSQTPPPEIEKLAKQEFPGQH